MDEIQKFMNDCYDSSRWYHARSDERRRFDQIVMEELGQGKKIGTAVKKVGRQLPRIGAVVSEQTIPELKDYYSRLRRMEQEIAIATNMRRAAAARKRKRKAQQA